MQCNHRRRPGSKQTWAPGEALEPRLLLVSPFVVTSLSDATSLPNNLVDLRMAITSANAAATASTITFDPQVFSTFQTISLSGGTLEITNAKAPVTIVGPAAGVGVSGNNQSTVFSVDAKAVASFSNIEIADGNDSVQTSYAGGGGGILNNGTVKLSNLEIYGNSATNANSGGGISNNGMMTLTDVTIAQNSADSYGGGIFNTGTITLNNVSVLANSAGQAGGIMNTSGGTTTLNNVTIFGNDVPSNATTGNAGIWNALGTVRVGNSIIANNIAGRVESDMAGAATSAGYNLIGATDGSTGWNTADLTGTAAQPLKPDLALGAVGDLLIDIPQLGSPAIDAGSNALVPAGISTDERGLPRVSGKSVDIGAVEDQQTTYTGVVYNDANGDGKQGTGELGLPGVTVYADLFGSGKFVAGDPFTVTDGSGKFSLNLSGDAIGQSEGIIRQVLPPDDSQITPSGGGGISVTFAGNTTKTGINFGDHNILRNITGYLLKGTVFHDANRNGRHDSGEAGLGGWEIYDDVHDIGKFAAGDPFTFTNSTGAYTLGVLGTGTAILRQILPANWSQTTPTGGTAIRVALSPTSTKTGLNFGDYTAVKYLSTVATTPGLAAWWTFDNASQANSIVNGITGTLEGGAKITTSAGAPITGDTGNTGLSLNGASAFVNTDLSTQDEFATAVTLNVWVNLGGKVPAAGKIETILAKSQMANDMDLQLESDGRIYFYTDNTLGASFKPASLTGWHMLTAEFDTAAKTREIFWDGRLVISTNPFTEVHAPSINPFSIGASDLWPGRYYDGSIDEVSLWNRALTAEEILAVYNAAK